MAGSGQLSHPFSDLMELERRDNAGISAIKLKSMAMRMRHRVRGYEFQPASSGSDLQQPLERKTAPRTRSMLIEVLHGPENLKGLMTIFLHPFCILLVFIPLGIASSYLNWGSSTIFWFNFFALVPLAKILGDATEELAGALQNDAVSGLLNATFGNAVEMIVAIQSLRQGLIRVVKTSLLGSVLSNILLVLGTAFLLGGLTVSSKQRGPGHSFNDPSFKRRWVGFEKEQKFAIKGALISMAMLLFSCMSFALPTIFNAFPSDDSEKVLKVSRIGAWIVMSSYVAFLFFQLATHTKTLSKEENALGGDALEDGGGDDDDDEDEGGGASLTAWCALLLMALTTVVVSFNSGLLVDAIQAMVKRGGIPESFIGVILLPLAGNACEHASAIRFAMQDRPGLAIGIAVGSSTQVALLVVPFSVIAAWVMGQPMNLDFGCLDTAVVTLSVLVVLTLLLDGRSNWLKGYIMCALYVFIAVLYWFIPTSENNI